MMNKEQQLQTDKEIQDFIHNEVMNNNKIETHQDVNLLIQESIPHGGNLTYDPITNKPFATILTPAGMKADVTFIYDMEEQQATNFFRFVSLDFSGMNELPLGY